MSIYSQITGNKIKTYVLMLLFVVFFSAVIYVLSLALGLPNDFYVIAIVVSTLISIVSYYFSDSMVMAISGAKEMKNTPGQDIFDIVTNLSIAAGIPAPKVYLINDRTPNAFATGRDPQHASVAVTSGLLSVMNKTELEGIVGHELAHIKNFDTRLSVMISVLVGSVALLSDFFLRSLFWRDRDSNKGGGILILLGIVFAILSPVVSTLIQLAISRRRELLADASGALLTRYPEGLAKALLKLENSQNPRSSFASNATAHLFIVNPFGKKSVDWLTGLFQTHPPLEERIKILRNM